MATIGERLRSVLRLETKAQVERPLINENASPLTFSAFGTTGGTAQTSNSPVDYKALWEIWLSSPEAISPCETIVTDIISDGFTIKPITSGSSGKQLVARAQEFLDKNQFKTRVQPALLYDRLVTGDAYLYKPRLTEGEVRSAIRKKVNNLPVNNKKVAENYLYYSMVDEDTYKTKELISIASSTIRIKHDEFGNVISYEQRVGSNSASFTTDEIIHWKYMHINGRMYSFCPLKALIPELTLIAAIKDTAGMSFDNGGVPNYIFNLPEETPDSRNVNFLQQQLKLFKDMASTNHSLVTTGEVNVEVIQNLMKDMQFRDLLEQMTRIVYTTWGVPPSKMGQAGGGDGAYDTGLATEGYYRRISNQQDQFYTPLNTQLMMPEFGVQLIPNKSYLQDELRETQMLKQKFDIAQQAWQQNWWNEKAVIDFLEIPDEYKGTFEKNDPKSMLNQGLLTKKEVNEPTAKKEVNEMRSKTQKEKTPQVKALEAKGFTPSEIEAILQNDRID